MKTIVTGASGFMGKELVRALVSKHHSVAEINRVNTSGIFSNLNLALNSDERNIAAGIRKVNPDVIFHLASNTSIKASWGNPFQFIIENIALAENLLAAIELSGTEPLLVLASSSSVYDDTKIPISETFRLAPSSPYAISKLATETIALRYPKTIVIRPFFTIGSSRRGDVIDEWLTKIHAIRESKTFGVLEVGDLSLERDYLDVAESARLLIELSEKGSKGEIYNICSGISTSLQQICDALIEYTDSTSLISVQSNGTEDRTTKKSVVGDISKLRTLGIRPNFNLEESLRNLINTRNN